MSTTRPDNTPTRAAAVHAFTDDGLGKIPNVVIVDANGNSASPTVPRSNSSTRWPLPGMAAR